MTGAGTATAGRRRRRARPQSGRIIGSIDWWTLALALVACALLGGSNRAEVGSLLVLRPLLVVALGVLLLSAAPVQGASDQGRDRFLPWLFAAWALAIAWQLVPLPPTIWTALPGRELAARAGEIGGFAPGWHPVSLTPERTWNSLLALLPAMVILVGVPRLSAEHRKALVMIVFGIAFAGILAAVVQAAIGTSSSLYLYRGTNDGALAGLFANRNHNVVFLVAMLPLLDAWLHLPAASRERLNVRRVVVAGGAAAVVMLALISGSRAGLLVLGLCVAAIAVGYRHEFVRLRPRARLAIMAAGATFVAVLVLLAVLFGRALSVERLVVGSQSENRLVNLPIVGRIMRDHFPVGSGFGSFDPVFRGYEPDALLKPTYFNHAHNDLLETVMTGGLPALLVVGVFLGWFALATVRVFRGTASASGEDRMFARAAAIGIALLLLASLVDYPLRTPFLTAVLAFLCVLLRIGTRAQGSPGVRLHGQEGAGKARPAAPPDPR